MKTWILKNNLSYSPQSSLRMYSGARRSRFSSDMSFSSRSKQHFLVRRLRSQLKFLSRHLNYEIMAEMNKA